jgi:hypothetical protein
MHLAPTGEVAPLPAVLNLFRLWDEHPELLKDLVLIPVVVAN